MRPALTQVSPQSPTQINFYIPKEKNIYSYIVYLPNPKNYAAISGQERGIQGQLEKDDKLLKVETKIYVESLTWLDQRQLRNRRIIDSFTK